MAKKEEKKLSTPIKVLLIVFYPFGLFYFIYWLIQGVRDPERASKHSRWMMILGAVLIPLGIIYVVMALTGQFVEGSNIATVITIAVGVFMVGGAALLIFGRKYSVLAASLDRYLSCIRGSGVDQIDQIATTLRTSPDRVMKELQTLIDKGFLEGAFIDHRERRIILPRSKEDAPPEKVAVTCPHCNAHQLIVPGRGNLCEYCGGAIEE